MKKSNASVLFAAILALSNSASAIYQNGGFEQNSFTSWTLGGGTNPGLSGATPFTGASVVISGSVPGPSSVVGTGTTDPRAPTLVLPRVGQYTAKLNDESTGAIVTTIAQTDVISNADLDPADNQLHVRFAFAPVLDDPSHTPNQQPYFYVRVKNTTDDVVLFEQFAYSGQAGVQFLPGTGTWKYLNFQNVDAVLPQSALNKNIETYVVAADCSLGGHAGYVYLDGFGSTQVGGGGGPAQIVQAPSLNQFGGLVLLGCFLMLGISQLRQRFSA